MIALHVAQLCNKVAVFLVDSAFIGFPPGKFKQWSLAVVTTGKCAMVTEKGTAQGAMVTKRARGRLP